MCFFEFNVSIKFSPELLDVKKFLYFSKNSHFFGSESSGSIFCHGSFYSEIGNQSLVEAENVGREEISVFLKE